MGAKTRRGSNASGNLRGRTSDRLRARLVVGLAIGFVVLFAAVVALKLSRDHRETLIAAEHDLAATTTSLAAQYGAVLGEFHAILDQASATWKAGEPRLGVPTLAALKDLSDQVKATPAVADLVVLAATGAPLYRVAGPSSQLPGDWTADRFLGFYGGQAGDDLYIVDGKELLLAKRFKTAAGEVSAVALLRVAPDLAHQLSRTVNFDARKHVVLAGRDGSVLDYAPREPAASVGSVRSLLGMDWPTRQARPDPIVAYTRTPAGEDLLVVGRTVTGTPFHVFIAERVADVLAPWSADLVFYALIVLAPSLFGAAVCAIILQQISEQRAITAARNASEARLNLTFAGARLGIWDWHLDTNRLIWSPSMYAMLGRSEGKPDLDPVDVRALMNPSDRPILDRIAQAASTDKGAYDEVFRLRHAHGHWIWVHAKGKIHEQPGAFGNGPRQRRLMGIALDVTQLKQAEARTAEAEAQLRDAIENISEAFVLWDAKDKLLLCNKNFGAFYQISPQVLRPGGSRREILAAAAVPIEVLHEEGAVDGAPTKRLSELQHVGSRWLHVSTRVTKDGGYVSVGTDVTPLKEQEAELLKNEARLKEYVDVLKASETNLRKEATQRAEMALKYGREKSRAEEAARSKTEFLANMSHELRTPLNAIMGFAQIMQDGMFGSLGDDRYRDYTGHILQSAKHLLDLINDILDMSKIESGKMRLEQRDIDVNGVVGACVRFIEPKVFEAGLHLKIELADLPTVYGDDRAIKQVLLNLLTNAVKFTQRGGTITIGGEVTGDHVILSVADTGIGIPAEDLPRICNPFEQIESQRNKKHKGSGLGLALAKSLTELQSGSLEIKSELGLGTTVRVMLPRQPRKVSAADAA